MADTNRCSWEGCSEQLVYFSEDLSFYCSRHGEKYASSSKATEKVSPLKYYQTFYGHDVDSLEAIYRALAPKRRFVVYLAGDSSLDNKYWFFEGDRERLARCLVPAVNGHQEVLDPPMMVPDVNFHLNRLLEPMGGLSINAAVETSKLADRRDRLLEQDRFIADHLTRDDVVVVSVGGNDIALAKDEGEIEALRQVFSNSLEQLETAPIDELPGFDFLKATFGDRMRSYLARLTERCSPRLVVVSVLYFPDLNDQVASWASAPLELLEYDREPGKFRAVMRRIEQDILKQIELDGTRLAVFPMYRALDGSDTGDYFHRVEPSGQGGSKLAECLLEGELNSLPPHKIESDSE
jgi:hypothetical protein